MLKNDAPPINNGSTGSIDTTIVQTFGDLKAKADDAKYDSTNRTGKKRGPYKKTGLRPDDGVEAPPSKSMGAAGFTEEQITAVFKGVFSMGALATDCNVWVLTDDEAKCFVPSATLGINQTFPGVATSKWGALSLASISLFGVVFAKTMVYMSWKRHVAAEATKAGPKEDEQLPMAA